MSVFLKKDPTPDEMKALRDFSDLVYWSKQYGRPDITAAADRANAMNDFGELRKLTAELNGMKATGAGASATPASDPSLLDPTLGANTTEKDYAKPSGNINEPILPEPDFRAMPPPAAAAASAAKPPEPDKRFASVNDLPKAAAGKSADALADMAADAYVQYVPAILSWFCKRDISADVIENWMRTGEVDLEYPIKVPPTKKYPMVRTITVAQWIIETHEEIDATFVKTAEFRNALRDAFLEYAQLRGWGVTPEQKLIKIIVEDMGHNLKGIITLKGSINDAVEFWKENMNAGKSSPNNNNNKPQEEPAAGYTAPPPAPEPPSTPPMDFTPPPPADDKEEININGKMHEVVDAIVLSETKTQEE